MTPDPGTPAALRARLARLEGFDRYQAPRPALPFGLPAIDKAIPGGCLVSGALHELAGTGMDTEHGATPAPLAASLSARLSGHVCWIMNRTPPFSPALAGVGLDPNRVLFVEAGGEILQTLEDCVRCAALRAVVAEVTGAFGLTASRRLQLAAEASGVTVLVIRRSRRFDDPALDAPSAALARWRVSGVPSPPVIPDEPDVPGVGRPRWRLELRRARGGQPRSWLVDGPDARGLLAPADDSRRGADRELRQRRIAG